MSTCKEQYQYFSDYINHVLDTYLPYVTVKRSSTDKPWVTDNFRELIAKRQQAFNAEDEYTFNKYRNRVNRASKNLKKSFYKNSIESLRNSNSSQWWNKTKRLTGNVKDPNLIKSLHRENPHNRLSDEINLFLESVTSDLNPLSLTGYQNSQSSSQIPDRYIVQIDEVEKALFNININKAIGPDEIPNWILRDLCQELAKPICAIFNSSIREGFIPMLWKSANVIPVPKCNHPSDITKDIRPISLIPSLMKILESIVGKWMWDIVGPHIKLDQYGAVKNSSTSHALIDMVHHWHNALHDKKLTRVLLLDFSKAFDRVDHNKLFEKLKLYNMPEFLLKWIYAFLSDRQQRVRISEEISEWIKVRAGVPQGSYFGPLLFIIMVNDLQVNQENCFMHKFVDDSTVTEIIEQGNQSEMQSAVQDVSDWNNENGSKLNPQKCKELIIKPKCYQGFIEPVQVEGKVIRQVKSSKLLGITINENLTWNEHINNIVKKANKRLFFLRTLKKSGVSTEDLNTYYKSVIRPVLEYCCQVWHPPIANNETQTNKIEHIQERAAKIMLPYMETHKAKEALKLESLFDRREKLCKRFFIAMCNSEHRLHYLLPARNNHDYNTRGCNNFKLPKCLTEKFKNSFVNYCLFKYQ